jgi:diguanylate cyclase (GGDEF)-like protein/PAS domain S-box-containing protein
LLERKNLKAMLLGAGLALAAALSVEVVLRGGFSPFSPIGVPGIASIAAGALAGMPAFLGGGAVVVAYYLVNAAYPERFPQFFSGYWPSVSWAVALTLLGMLAVLLRARMQRAETAAAYDRALRDSEAHFGRALRESEERLRAALDGSSVALWDTDLRTGRVYLSEAWSAIVGAPRAETITTTDALLALLHPDDVEPVKRVSREALKGERAAYVVEHRARSALGEWKWILSRGRVTERDPASGRALRMIGTNVDITERKRIEEALQSVAQSDPLTGVANRTALMDRLGLALVRARRNASQAAVLYLDIDRFKQVNDSLGHAAGDALLRAFAERLAGCVRASDTIARLGGDEFVVLLEDLKDAGSTVRVAEKILDAMRAPVRLESHDILVTTSIGIAQGAPEDGDALLRRADQALYAAKAGGRNTFRVAA